MVKQQSRSLPTTSADQPTRRQKPFPAFGLEQSLIIAQAIADNNAGKPYSRLSLAESIGRSPESSAFRALITSSAAYGLTEGSYKAPQIKLTELGASIATPRSEDEKRAGLIRAARNIPMFQRLYDHFDQHKIPPRENFRNTLFRDFGVDPQLADECVEHFRADGRFAGLIRDIAGAERVSIQDATEAPVAGTPVLSGKNGESEPVSGAPQWTEREPIKLAGVAVPAGNRVFISHGKNQEIVKQLKALLVFGKFEPVVAVEHETTARPVPEKVMEDMRACFAGIIHVASEEELLDKETRVHHRLNENVLIEIGAAMALYKKNLILLVQKGIHLPSNLQGLYRCEYDGEKLDYEATMKLLKTFSEFGQ